MAELKKKARTLIFNFIDFAAVEGSDGEDEVDWTDKWDDLADAQLAASSPAQALGESSSMTPVVPN